MDKMFTNWSEMSKNSFNNMKELSEINMKALERMGEQQMAWFSMLADMAGKQMEVASEAKSYQDVLNSQSELTADMSNKALEIANKTTDILNESKEEMSGWFEKTMKGMTSAAKSTAKKAAA